MNSKQKTQSDTLQEAYTDRNLAVMALVRLAHDLGYSTGIKENKDDVNWPILFIDLPSGQVSWHIPVKFALEAGGFGVYENEWDGHTLETKQERMMRFIKIGGIWGR